MNRLILYRLNSAVLLCLWVIRQMFYCINAGITIGFVRVRDTVMETTPGFINIFVEVISGRLQGRSVVVSYSTADSTASNAATSKFHVTL